MSEVTEKSEPKGLQYLGALVVVAVLGWLFMSLDWNEVADGFRKVDYRLLPVLVILLALNFVLRSWRWGWLLPGGRKLPLKSLLEATVFGFMASFVLPFRAGEVARPWMLSRWEPVRFGAGMASIVVERILDALVVVGILGLSVGHWESTPTWLGAGARLLGVVGGLGIAGLVLAYLFSAAFTKFGQKMVSLVFRGHLEMKLHELVDEFFIGLRAIKSFSQLAVVVVTSILMWLEMAAFYQVGLHTMSLSLPLWAGVTVMVLVALAVAVPGLPGFLGTFQFGCVGALALYAIGNEEALSYSIVMHVVQAVGIIGAGLWILKARGLSLKAAMER
ncbi:lysylphosphatidylglycerol synthase transmembrane domain-containing protein [Haloferula chungangensis]|uniref:Lysylphosphatidylglycerol synthase transmembrane domain-containing protein n=1 Tax=Haloferula chungangensis TaxID=1048331 RepID=A0ABW2LA72_9BACT